MQDDFEYWHAEGETDNSGKLFLLPTDNSETLSLFFDDNIERDRSHIVDVRDRDSFVSLTYESVIGKHIIRVQPMEAILYDDYYVSLVDQLLRDHHESHRLLSHRK